MPSPPSADIKNERYPAFSYTCGYNVQSGAMSDLLAAAIAHNPARSAQSKVGGKCEIFGHGRFAAALAARNHRLAALAGRNGKLIALLVFIEPI